MAFMNMTEVLKEEMSKSLTEIHKDTNSGRKWIEEFRNRKRKQDQ